MTATARLDLRMDARDKDKIARAANLRGVPVATFVRLAALREAETTTENTSTTTTLAHQLRGRATARLSTDEIMQLTRGA